MHSRSRGGASPGARVKVVVVVSMSGALRTPPDMALVLRLAAAAEPRKSSSSSSSRRLTTQPERLHGRHRDPRAFDDGRHHYTRLNQPKVRRKPTAGYRNTPISTLTATMITMQTHAAVVDDPPDALPPVKRTPAGDRTHPADHATQMMMIQGSWSTTRLSPKITLSTKTKTKTTRTIDTRRIIGVLSAVARLTPQRADSDGRACTRDFSHPTLAARVVDTPMTRRCRDETDRVRTACDARKAGAATVLGSTTVP